MDKKTLIKCYGKLPQAKIVHVSNAAVPHAQLRLQLIQSIVKPRMTIHLDLDTTINIEGVDLETDICLITSQTAFESLKPSFEQEAPVLTALRIENPSTSFDRAYNRIYDIISGPILHHDFLVKVSKTGKPPSLPKGVLITGPPGCGKSFLVNKIVGNLAIPSVMISGPSIFSSVIGEGEENIHRAFQEAHKKASCHPLKNCILFIDEIDSIGGKRMEGKEQEAMRLVAQLLVLMDGSKVKDEDEVRVVVIGATNKPDDLDPALRRPGRFDIELILDPPSIKEREVLLGKMFSACVGANIDFLAVAKATVGYVPADLAALHRETVMRAVQTQPDVDNPVDYHITTENVIAAMRRVGPSLIRDYRVAVEPEVTLNSIGGYESVKYRLETRVLGPLRNPERLAHFHLHPARGVLLHGPPGCSKTTFAKALANTAGCSFFSLHGASVFSSYVGEAERIIRDTFAAARMASPSILFVDEIDAMVGKRSTGGEVRDQVQERVLATFLIEMDGVSSDADTENTVIVLAATNRIDAIDSAILRPGRFDELILVDLPNAAERLAILRLVSRRTPLADDVDLEELAERTEGFSGARLKNLIQEAGFVALRKGASVVNLRCIEHSLNSLS